jgi:hypothetical protein
LPRQVKEHDPDVSKERHVKFSNTTNISPSTQVPTRNKITARWGRKLKLHQSMQQNEKTTNTILNEQIANIINSDKHQFILGVDNKELQQGVNDGTIPSIVADSRATSGVATEKDPCP